jgi:predicted DNA-binding transcriptional regulator AlpA
MRNKTVALPAFLAPHRVLTSAEAAAYCGFCVQHWRVLARTGVAPAPIKLSERKLGWRVSQLDAWIASRSVPTFQAWSPPVVRELHA